MALDLLLEIGSEEIPAGYIDAALKALKKMATETLKELRLSHGEAIVWGTPRRLALLVHLVSEVQTDLEQEVIGPPAQIAYDEKGEPTSAARGFAKAQGVPVHDLKIIETRRGPYLAAQKREQGFPAIEVLPPLIPAWIKGIPFPKSMRWGHFDIRFARPIHWLVALLGEEVLPFEIENLSSGRTTRGHRFMSPGGVDIPTPHIYRDICRSVHVYVDPDERREEIRRTASEMAESFSGRIVEDEGLLDTVVHLVEYPAAIGGSFESEFLNLPREVLITAMREQQKFFSVEDARGRLLNHFVNIANIRPASLALIKEGNERVLKARLSDARFFFEEDRKRPLADRVRDLQGVIFHAKLGTLYEKVQRIRVLGRRLAQELDPPLVDRVDRAALLCKADLATEMVKEFPSLQGVMGRQYALCDGEDTDVASAIREHYLPAFSGDRLPSHSIGAILGMADKLDTVVGCFGAGEAPTGAGDPFGLRRAALGVIHIMQDQGYGLSLNKMFGWCADLLEDRMVRSKQGVIEEVSRFFRARLQNLWISQGRSVEAVEAVLSAGFDHIHDAFWRMDALQIFMDREGFTDLTVTFKRVLNIVGDYRGEMVDPMLFEQPEEEELYNTLNEVRRRVVSFRRQGEALQALEALAAIRGEIDRFFEAVLVNVENKRLRENRLNMLSLFGQLFLEVADFSKISSRP